MNKIKLLHFSYLLLLGAIFLGCNSSSQENKDTSLRVSNIQELDQIPTNADIYLEFSKEIDPQTVNEDSFYLLDNNDTKVDGTLKVSVNKIEFLPTKHLQALQNYTLIVTQEILSTAGNGLLEEYRWHFKTLSHADIDAPKLLSTLPQNNASIYTEMALEFDEQVVSDSTDVLQLKDSKDTIIAGTSSIEYNIIRFSPDNPLAENENYTLSLEATIKDLYDNEYNSTTQWNFTTSENEITDTLTTKEVSSLQTQDSILSISIIDDILISGGESKISTYRINSLTCKLSTLHSFELNTPAYIIESNTNKDVIFTGSSDGVHLLSLNTSGEIGNIFNTLYKTDAPVYDLDIWQERVFLAKTTLGAEAIDISEVSNPIKLFDFTDINMATEIKVANDTVYIADNSLKKLFEFSTDGNLINTLESSSNIYDLDYNSSIYMANGINGFSSPSENSTFTRSFINNILHVTHQKTYTILNDKNRGLIVYDDAGKRESFISYRKGLFGLAQYENCLLLGYEDGFIQAVDIFAPFVKSSNPSDGGTITKDKESIVVIFDEKVDSATIIDKNFIFTDNNGTNVAYTLSFDKDKIVTITPNSSLHVENTFSLHVNNIEDIYQNIMKEPFVLNFDVNYTENIAPVANDDSAIMDEDTVKDIYILDNDIDYNGNDTIDKSSVIISTSPQHGIISVDNLGVVTYQPYTNYFGLDSFKYIVSDTDGATSNIATVNITIKDVYDPPPNQAPVANDDSAKYAGQAVDINVLSNDTDANSNIDPTTVTITKGSDLGSDATITVNQTTGVITYELITILTYPDTFRYTVSDTNGAISNEATVTVYP